jgi:hypothetical protein
MIIRGGKTCTAIGLLTLACSGGDDADGNQRLEREPALIMPAGSAGGGAISPPGTATVGAPTPTGTSAGDCSSIAGDGPLVAVGSPLQIPRNELGSSIADAYRFRAAFGYLQVTVRSDGVGRARVFEQGAAGVDVLVWNVQATEASTETLVLPNGAYAISFEPLSTTATGADISLEAGAYQPTECETATDAPTALGALTAERSVRAGYVGRVDQRDTFGFELPEAATLSLALTEARGDVELRLFVDGDTLVDGDALTLLIASEVASRSIALPRGTYQLRVSPAFLADPNNLYTLSASAVEYPVHDHPGDDGDGALEVQDLGTLGAAGVTLGGYIGALDALDAFRIQLAEPAAIVLGFTDASSDPVARLFVDAPAVDNDDALLTVFGPAQTTEVLSPGTYLIRVAPSLTAAAHSFYRLDVGLAR